MTVVIAGMRHRARLLEMAHRERLAMIERGMVPPPEGMLITFAGGAPAAGIGWAA